MSEFIENVIFIAIIVFICWMINGCSKKIGLIQPDKCKEMKFITIDNEEINGYPNNLKRNWNKFYYVDNLRFIEIKEAICTRYGYWDEN